MGEKTGISWTERTMNFWRGCTKVSKGCSSCYMFREMERYGLDPTVVTRCKTWNHPKKWNKECAEQGKPCLVFTCSWSDFFHRGADAWREEAWKIIKETPWLQYQILTKRINDVKDRLPEDWGEGYPNVWLGVSIEDDEVAWRADALREVPARIRWISAEPLIGPIPSLNLTGMHWLIAGGESGPNFRPMNDEWALELLQKCRDQNVAFFYKQGAHTFPGQNNKLRGVLYQEYPVGWEPK